MCVSQLGAGEFMYDDTGSVAMITHTMKPRHVGVLARVLLRENVADDQRLARGNLWLIKFAAPVVISLNRYPVTPKKGGDALIARTKSCKHCQAIGGIPVSICRWGPGK